MRATWPAHTLPKLPLGTVKLTFYRGPIAFLYGPTAPDAFWYTGTLLKE